MKSSKTDKLNFFMEKKNQICSAPLVKKILKLHENTI